MAAAAGPYKLRCNVVGHRADVRSLAAAPGHLGDSFISGSRDMTARLWTPDKSDQGFSESHVMQGHKNFIACVCAMPPNANYPQGLILTGSNDCSILAFTLDSLQPVYKLTGHTGTVSALTAGKVGSILSGSWDKSAKVWLAGKCVMTLEGHTEALWAVAVIPHQGLMLTGSADKTIRIWKAGKCEAILRGHTDCVRGLAVLESQGGFLSCSNDGTVRYWLLTGENTYTYCGHENFIYSIALLPGNNGFVTTSEDQTLRVWQGYECVQKITHPTTTVWSVCVLDNGDIVTGASDGVIRVFSKSPERAADPAEQKAFEEAVAASFVPKQIGDVKLEDIPGEESLLNPGKKEGQTKMVRKGDKVELYQWDSGQSNWKKIGDVIGSGSGSHGGTGKTVYQGKEYDYVFTVDIDPNRPALKLPYNSTEDPWMAAHNFLENNDLSPMFLDLVANFIINNSKGANVQAPIPSYSDPFTGGSRYIPGASAASGLAQNAVDPFTGGGRYVPSVSQSSAAADPVTGDCSYKAPHPVEQPNEAESYFPKTTYLTFDTANLPQILAKLKEFSGQLDAMQRVPNESIDQLCELFSKQSDIRKPMQTLDTLLSWPRDMVFPALDVMRMAIKHQLPNQILCAADNGENFVTTLCSFLQPTESDPNKMLALRIFSNMFSEKCGEQVALNTADLILTTVTKCETRGNKNIQIAASTVLLNYAVNFYHSQNSDGKSECLSAAKYLLDREKLNPEAAFRILVTLGTLMWNDTINICVAHALGLEEHVKNLLQIKEPPKVGQCALLVLDLLKL